MDKIKIRLIDTQLNEEKASVETIDSFEYYKNVAPVILRSYMPKLKILETTNNCIVGYVFNEDLLIIITKIL